MPELAVTAIGRPPTYNVLRKSGPHKQRNLRDAWKRECYAALLRAGIDDGVWYLAVDAAEARLGITTASGEPSPRIADEAIKVLADKNLRQELIAAAAITAPWERIDVTAQPFYADRRNLPDTDGIVPAVKWLLDSAVELGALAGDTRDHVRSIELLFPWVDRDLPRPQLHATITEADS